MVPSLRLITAIFACAFLAAHVYFAPRSLEDIDSINFALGVESFDVVNHRPHPPGYPVFVAMGKVSTALLGVVAPWMDRDMRAAVGLAGWGIVAGAVFLQVLFRFWRSLGWKPAGAWFAGALAVVSPLFWFTSARPLTDAVALVAACGVQATIVRSCVMPPRSSARPLLVAAFLAGLLIGVRTQTMWLTGGLLAVAVVVAVRRHSARLALSAVVSAAAGCFAWAIPLVINSGGLTRYLAALAAQGSEDFGGVEMLATSADEHLVPQALYATFVAPWRVEWLGELVCLLAVAGLFRLARHGRRELLLITAAFVPYVVFHLAFQETETVRYALPLVVPMAGLAVHALFALPVRVAVAAAMLVTTATLVTAGPSLSAFGRIVPPTVQAMRTAATSARDREPTPLVVTHAGLRRLADWYRVEWPELPAMSTRDSASQRIIEHFLTGTTDPVWFLADSRKTDIVLFDPRARRLERQFLQEPEVRYLVGRAREDDVHWWKIERPRWMLGSGWALSPEVAGITFASGRDPRLIPAEGFIRRLGGPGRLLVGGRYLQGDRDASLVVDIDGQEVGRWPVTRRSPWFLHVLDVPAGVMTRDGAYARLSVRVETVDGPGLAPRVALQQFDFAAPDDVMSGLSDGWYEAETDVDTGQSWRWAGPQATLLVYGGGPVRLTLASESSLRYFPRPSHLRVLVDGREAGRLVVSGDVVETFDLPADLFTSEPARVTLESDQSFAPAERGGSVDQRRLALRFFSVEVSRPD